MCNQKSLSDGISEERRNLTVDEMFINLLLRRMEKAVKELTDCHVAFIDLTHPDREDSFEIVKAMGKANVRTSQQFQDWIFQNKKQPSMHILDELEAGIFLKLLNLELSNEQFLRG